MGQEWVEGNIQRLLDIPPDSPWYQVGQHWGNLLLDALENHTLRGIAYSTPFTPSGAAGPTTVIDTWSYEP